jgi:DNA-directed RNA polymerase
MNLRLKSKRISVSSQLMVAERFKEKEAFYYVWTLDWRGRAYPLASFMHPQADDSGKALLQFAEGKKLGENGGYWLAVHIAGLFGVDKCSFDERVQWVYDHEEEILDSAISPLDGQRFWCGADKPWCALAACFEWFGYQLDGNKYISHLPVAMDGSCNGLQNFSAVLRDEVGGKAVNLLPSETPQDIYTEVMNVVIGKLAVDSPWKGLVTRKIVKRPVMTLPYGASQFGMRQQVIEEVVKIEEETGVSYLGLNEKDTYKSCGDLAAIIYSSIGEVVIAAKQAMDWLQSVARIAAKDGLPIHWHTPMGFPVLQNYYESDVKRVRVMMGTQQISLRTQVDSTRINKRRMAQGIAPNVVHSWDAAHMMRTIIKCKDAGIEHFSMIHDSYGTHACDVETMATCLREAFIEQYTPDLLEEFKQEIMKQLPDKLIEKLPDIPPKGTLDLSLVLQSEFFFA